jgi:hypothetical protein
MRLLLILLFLGGCFKKKKVEQVQPIERDTGLITEEELEELPER